MCHKKYLKGFLFVCTISYAAPDAGNISKDIENQLQQQSVTKPQVLPSIKEDKQKSEQKIEDSSGVKVLVNGFKISGNNSLETKDIELVISKYISQKMSFAQLQDITRTIADFYSQKGLSARSYFPPQEVENGILEIIIIEGNLSEIEIDTIDAKRFSPSYAQNIISNSHPVGQPLETKKLEHGVLLLADNPGIKVNSSLVQGKEAGDSKLKVKIEDTALFNGALMYSNSGLRSTGTDQYVASASINSPSAIGDQIIFQGMHTKGIEYGKIGYSFPIGYSGLKAGVNASRMIYEVVEGSDADGSSHSMEFNLTQPIIKSSESTLNISLGYDKKSYENKSYSILISDKTNNIYNLALVGSRNDEFGQTSFSSTFSIGELDLTDVDSDYALDQNTAKTNGDFSKAVFNISRKQNLTDDINLLVSGTLQKANKNLDSGEKLYLGGINGVKAYPTNEAGGDEGYMINTKITKLLPYGFSTSAFYDYGQVKQHDDLYASWQGSSRADNTYSLQGIGTSLGYVQGSFSVDTTIAYRTKDNPNRSVDGLDGDDTKKEPRIWVQLMKLF